MHSFISIICKKSVYTVTIWVKFVFYSWYCSVFPSELCFQVKIINLHFSLQLCLSLALDNLRVDFFSCTANLSSPRNSVGDLWDPMFSSPSGDQGEFPHSAKRHWWHLNPWSETSINLFYPGLGTICLQWKT